MPQKRLSNDRSIVSDVIGMYITSEKVQRDLLTTLPFNPQIEMRGTFFEDFDHWYKVNGKYIADGGERFVVIGNFQPDEKTNFKYTNPESGSVPNGAHVFIDDVLIEVFDPLSDTVLLCERQDIVLNAGFHDARYAWNTGHQDSVITVSRSGKYRVEATIDTLVFADSSVVLYMDELAQRTELDTFYCQDEVIQLRAPAPGRYDWSTGDTAEGITVAEEGLYQLSVENHCGQYEFTYSVFQRDCDCDLILPTAFTPDGDGSNDVFTIIDRCRYSNWNLESFRVYDKWGGLVYQERGSIIGWDGRDSRGRELPPGVYTYRMEAVVRPSGDAKAIVRTGTVQLLR